MKYEIRKSIAISSEMDAWLREGCFNVSAKIRSLIREAMLRDNCSKDIMREEGV